jgi:hypothetical protein
MAGIRGGFRNPLLTGVEIPPGMITSTMIATQLQSDTWNGTTVAARDATAGWRIEKDTGNIGVENLFARGSIFLGATLAGGEVVGDEDGWTLPGYAAFGIPEQRAVRATIKWSEPGDPSNWNGGVQGLEDGQILTVGATLSVGIGAGVISSGSIGLLTGRALDFASSGTPAISLHGDSNTGFHRPAADELAVYTGGVAAVVFSNPSSGVVRWTVPSVAATYIEFTRVGTVDTLLLEAQDFIASLAIANNTVSGLSSVAIDSTTGRMGRNVSSKRYKTDIKPWHESKILRRLTPVTFRSTTRSDDSRKRFLGLIAEDVADHFPLAAVLDGEGRPDAVDWNAITAGLLGEVKALHERVERLELAA